MKIPAVGQALGLQAASQAACLWDRHSRMIFDGAVGLVFRKRIDGHPLTAPAVPQR
jgi:hypothetical protein